MTAAEVLREARDLIADPARWTRGAIARTIEGVKLDDPADPDATAWCASAALRRVAGSSDCQAIVEARELLARHCSGSMHVPGPTTRIVCENDAAGHEAVLEAFSAAIAEAESQEAARG
jgi:hypothetical protein